MSDAVIIGSGLGGLLCGAILSRSGRSVTILEKGIQAGGCLQGFVREGVRFETGFHSVAGLEPGGPLEVIFRPLGLMDLPWEHVAETDEIVIGGVSRRLKEVPVVAQAGPVSAQFGTEATWMLGSAIRLSCPASEVTPFEYLHVMQPYTKGSWRLPSGDLIVKHLAAQIHGTIRTRCEVTAIGPGYVRCSDGSIFRSETIISDIHPRLTFDMFEGHVRPAYLRRIRSLENGPGIFTVYCKLRPETMRYQPWCTTIDGTLMVHYGSPDEKGFARTVDLLCFAPSHVTDRKVLAENMIRSIKGLEENIVDYWTSTPETWERYTGTPAGSAFGIRKKDATCFVHPRTPVPGLFLTGQNCGLHGVLGVAETALATCREIIGETAINNLFKR